MANGIDITDKEFFIQMARFADVTNLATVQKYWNAACEVIIRELFYNGRCRVPVLGTFGVKTMKGYENSYTTEDGREIFYKVEERIVPTFTPQDQMINDVNRHGVTKAYRKRLKQGRLGVRDFEREARREAIFKENEFAVKREERAKDEFQKLLEEKKNRIKGKVDLKEDED